MDIYPSVLEKKPSDLLTQLENVLPHFDHFQIDIADGIFVPTKTVQIDEISDLVTSDELRVTGKTFEFHLMVQNWKKEIPKLETLPLHITRVLVHFPVFDSNFQLPTSNFTLGLVFNPEDTIPDNIAALNPSAVQLMTVHPGTQGSPFVPEALHKIQKLRENGFTGDVILDGAMNDKTLAIVLQQKYLPNAMCPGSYFKEDVACRLERLQKMINNK